MIYDITLPSIHFDHLEKLKQEFDSLRPIDSQLMSRIERKIDIDRTYHSNSIEGNTLTYGETEVFLQKGLTSKGHTLNEYLEMKNHEQAIFTLKDYLKGEREFSESLIKEFHAMLFVDNETIQHLNTLGQYVEVSVLPGEYKKQHNYVLLKDGTKKWYEDPIHVQPRMAQLVLYYHEHCQTMHPLLLAAVIHAEFVNIHPFVDGNGRTARIIMNLILMKHGYVPAIIKQEERESYFDALEQFDKTGNLLPFVDEIEKAEIQTLELILGAVKNQVVMDQSDVKKVVSHFGEKMKALDKNIGKVSKKISLEEKKEEINKLRDYIYEYVIQTVVSDDLFTIEVQNNINLFEIEGGHLINYLESNNIYPESKIEDRVDGLGFVVGSYVEDIFDIFEGGSCVQLQLTGKRGYIPTFSIHFIVLPLMYSLSIVSHIIGTRYEQGKEKEGDPSIFSHITNGVLFADRHKEDIKHFINENLSTFITLVEAEAEKRRLLF